MQFDNGNTLTYSLEGTVNDAAYTVNMIKRTDGKKGCVLSGHVPEGANMSSHGLVGKVVCDGNVGFTVKAGF